MFRASTLVRQTLFAALVLLPVSAAADIAARFDPDSGSVVVTGVDADGREALVADARRVRLQRAEAPDSSGMLTSAAVLGNSVQIRPRFPLRAGESYALVLDMPEREPFKTLIELAPPPAEPPVLTAFAPHQAQIPANTLRFYLTFSEPMARKQVRKAIRVEHDGDAVESPFLNLETELWDPEQRRLTLLLDPGRVKQGVGPNLIVGAPLQEGSSYRLVVSGAMTSAAGLALGEDQSFPFRVVSAERRAIAPEQWRIASPLAGTYDPLIVKFDRIMDVGAAKRLLRVVDRNGLELSGSIITDGGNWALAPDTSWNPGPYRLVVDPALEDVSGNTIRSAFDAAAGTIGKSATPASLEFMVDAPRTASEGTD